MGKTVGKGANHKLVVSGRQKKKTGRVKEAKSDGKFKKIQRQRDSPSANDYDQTTGERSIVLADFLNVFES